MKAILIDQTSPKKDLYIADVPDPTPAPDQVVVKVMATALNRADLLQRQGKYPPPLGASEILGLEFAGEIVSDCAGWKVGDRVMGIVSGGSYAEYLAVPLNQLMPIPKGLTFEEGAAIPEAFLTAYQCLVWHGKIKSEAHKKSSLLIHAAASGVGTAAVQIAKAIGVNKVFVTSSSEEKLQKCKELGANELINYKDQDFSSIVLAATDNKGVSIIIDFIGAPYWEQNLKSISTDGTIVMVATMGGSVIEHFDAAPLFKKRVNVIATTLRNRDDQYKAKLSKEFSDWSLPLFEQKKLRPVIHKIFNWSDVNQAHALMEDSKNIGKIILKVVTHSV